MSESALDLSEYNGGALVATAAVFLTLSWIAFALRAFTRAVLMKGFKADDWLMLVGQIIFTMSCAFILEGVKRGLGRHNDAIKNDDMKVLAIKWQAVATATYVIDMMFIKLSIGVFLLRIAAKKVYTFILRISLVIITIWSTGTFIWDIFQCTPVEKQWDYRIKRGYCASPDEYIAAGYAISVMTIISDWLYALLPIPMLWPVKMTKQAKATVIAILSLGIFASIATLIRLRFLSDLEDENDILYAGTDAMVWTLIEPGLAIVASSLATIRPLLHAMRVRGFESTDVSRGALARGYRRHGRALPPRDVIVGQQADDIPLADLSRYQAHPNADSATENIALSFNAGQPGSRRVPDRENGISDSKSEVYVIEGIRSKSNPELNSSLCRAAGSMRGVKKQRTGDDTGAGSSSRA